MGFPYPPMTSRARYHLFLGALLRSTRMKMGILHTRNFRAGAKLVFWGPREVASRGVRETWAGGGPGDFRTLPMTSRASCDLFLGVLLRSKRMLRGVLHSYSFRANAKLVPRQHPAAQIGAVENTAQVWSARGITLPSPRLPASATIDFRSSSSDLPVCKGAFCIRIVSEQTRN